MQPRSGSDLGLIGQSVLRVEDGPLLTGRGSFVDDVERPGTLHAAFVRSHLGHARVIDVDVRPAASAKGVYAAASGHEMAFDIVPPVAGPNSFSPPRPALARDVVRFVGEPVAVVVASSRYFAEDAAELVVINYESLPVVSDPRDAVRDSAQQLHPPHSNVMAESRVEHGDLDRWMAGAAVIVEADFRNARCCACPLEPRGVLAYLDDDDTLVVYSSTQAPHSLRRLLAATLGLKPEKVRVVCPDIGGGFGQKAHAYPEEVVVPALALQIGRPVKWIEDRAENLMAASHARDQWLHAKVGADAEGHLLAIDVELVCDAGAYGVYPHGHSLEVLGTPAMIPGPYHLKAYRSRGMAVATNKCPEGAYRGVGLPVATLVHERLMDMLATELGLDRAEIRRRNYVRRDEFPYKSATGQTYDSGDYGAALDLALKSVDYEGFEAEQKHAKDGRMLGIGFASYVEYTAMGSKVFAGRGMVGIPGTDAAHVALQSSGDVMVWTTLPAIGQGSDTTFAQLAATELDLPHARVHVLRSDTAVGGLEGTGTFASRSAVSGGGAVVMACTELRARILADASVLLEVDLQDLLMKDGKVQVVGAPGRSVAVADLVAQADADRFHVSSTFDPPNVTYPYATHACVVSVDPGTGDVRLVRYVIAEDCGTVINPMIVDGQVHGATAQGIGGALLEQLVYDADGQLKTSSLLDYLMPGSGELPTFEVHHLVTPAPTSTSGIKGVGEGGTLAASAAIANAVADAIGDQTMNTIPLTPENVLEGLRRARAARSLTQEKL